MGRVILTEKAELESEKTKLVEDVTANKKKTKELEDNLLYRLTSTQVWAYVIYHPIVFLMARVEDESGSTSDSSMTIELNSGRYIFAVDCRNCYTSVKQGYHVLPD